MEKAKNAEKDVFRLFYADNSQTQAGGSAPIIPIVDLNGDGIVNAADMCIIVDSWGEDYSLRVSVGFMHSWAASMQQ